MNIHKMWHKKQLTMAVIWIWIWIYLYSRIVSTLFNVPKCTFIREIMTWSHACNKCIKDDMKGAARRRQHYITNTKNTFCATPVFVPSPKFCDKLFPTQNFTEIRQSAELWPKKTNFKIAAVRHLVGPFLKCSHLIIWLSSSSKCAVVYEISSKSDDLLSRYGDFTMCNLADVWILNLRSLEFMSCDLYRNNILLPCAKFR